MKIFRYLRLKNQKELGGMEIKNQKKKEKVTAIYAAFNHHCLPLFGKRERPESRRHHRQHASPP